VGEWHPAHWGELAVGLSCRGHDLFHVALDADETVLRARIEADVELSIAKRGRLDHLVRYAEAREWMSRRADLVIDTTELTPQEVADEVWDAVRRRLLGCTGDTGG
jgi:hypothetical protein